MRVTAIIQARLGSTRLPGKILKEIGGKPMLLHCYDRAIKSKLLDDVIVATSINKENDTVEQFCADNAIPCFRGSEDDVLGRFYQCAKLNEIDIIVRLTADCPLVDPDIIDKLIQKYKDGGYDYIKNTWFKNAYPSGFDVEVFNFETLESHWKSEQDVAHREHVLSTLSNSHNKLCYSDLSINYLNNLSFDLNLLHLSVDTSEDFNLVKHIIEHFDGRNFTFEDVIDFLNANPLLATSNVDDEFREKIVTIKQLDEYIKDK